MQLHETFELGGGLDLVTPASKMPPGRVIGCVNYEPDDQGGYRRILGYERFDGLPSPSDADYWLVPFDAGQNEPSAGDILDGGTSTVSSEVLSVVVESGAWATNDAAGYIVVFNASGFYVDDEALTVGATAIATTNGSSSRNSASTTTLDETYTRAAREATRDDIGSVPGSGTIRGVYLYKNTNKVYAIRDNAGGTAAVMHESSTSGWTPVDLGEYIDYTAGTTTPAEGDTITQGAVTATIVGFGVTSGSWSGNDAAGRVYITGRAGGSFSAGAATTTSGGALTVSGAETVTTLPAGGQYEFMQYNFGGQGSTRYMWAACGEGRAFRFDGTNFAFIHITGLSDSTDKPSHIRAHKRHLFLTVGSSLFNSSIRSPLEFDSITGAAELATGDTIVGIDTEPGDVLAIYNRNSTYLLYGTSSADWDLKQYSLERGAIEWSLQNVMVPLYVDDRGVTYLNPVQDYGDFKATTISEWIDPLIQSEKNTITTSARIKDKNQYRLFFEDNTALLARVSASLKIEYMVINYGIPVRCICAEEDDTGAEQVYFGSDDGYIYQAEKGESFDGEVIDYYLRFPYHHCGLPRIKKRFHKISILIDATQDPDLSYLPDYSYGNSDTPSSNLYTLTDEDINAGGAYWGDANWGDFVWDGQPVGEAEAYIRGEGFNMSLTVRGESNYEETHSLKSTTYYFSKRGLRR